MLERHDRRYTVTSIMHALLMRDMQAWMVVKGQQDLACVITEIRRYPTGNKAGVIWGVAGQEMVDWVALDDVLADWARANGCQWLEADGRLGWERTMRKQGWKRTAVILERDL